MPASGQWVDALVRVQGPAVDALAATFAEDWALETGQTEPLQQAPERQLAKHPGQAPVQVLPSGPDEHVEAIEQIVLMAIYLATQELVLTTPYFVSNCASDLRAFLTAGCGHPAAKNQAVAPR